MEKQLRKESCQSHHGQRPFSLWDLPSSAASCIAHGRWLTQWSEVMQKQSPLEHRIYVRQRTHPSCSQQVFSQQSPQIPLADAAL